jgi:predicted metalloenzyme YecM
MILDNTTEFLDRIFAKLKKYGIDVSNYELDHIGYQASSDEDYDKVKAEVTGLGDFLEESIVNGRRVGHYRLNEPLKYEAAGVTYTIPAFEIYAPKEGQTCASALEHVEFVIPEGFDAFLKKYPAVEFDISKAHQDKFPMIKLGVSDGIQVKFHLTPMLKIVEQK